VTPQEIFDEVATRIIEQGGRCSFINGSGFDSGGYAYRNSKGQRCAVGWLMNDEEIAAYADYGSSIDALLEEQEQGVTAEDGVPMLPLRPFFKENIKLLRDLQIAHDFHQEPWMMMWQARMRNLAQNYNLDPSVLNQDLLRKD
jgi:hypothetical protein